MASNNPNGKLVEPGDDLIDRIYQSAFEQGQWHDLVEDVVSMVDASKGVLFTPYVPPPDGIWAGGYSVSDSMLEEYRDYYFQTDIWFEAADGFTS